MADSDPFTEVRLTLESVEAALERAAQRVHELPPDDAFAAASELWNLLEAAERRFNAAVAELRATTVGRIWTVNKLSLAALADRIGVSKTRADQFIRAARKQPEES